MGVDKRLAGESSVQGCADIFYGLHYGKIVFSKCSNLVGNNLSVFNCITLASVAEHVMNGRGAQGNFLPGMLISGCNL